jgi:hypothetical protein
MMRVAGNLNQWLHTLRLLQQSVAMDLDLASAAASAASAFWLPAAHLPTEGRKIFA